MSSGGDFTSYGLVGDCHAMGRLYQRLDRIGRSRAPVFIHGEVGTGKSLCAKTLHQLGAAGDGSFVTLNADSDLAVATDIGVDATLVIDDVCELGDAFQRDLLEFLSQLDGACHAPRLVSITRHDPLIEVAEGNLREDLYYRLSVLPLSVPPLRLRGADIAKLANHFLGRFNRQENKGFAGIDDCALYRLEDHDWPGNVRELANLMHNTVVMHDGDVVTGDMFDDLIADLVPVPVLDFGGLGKDGAVPLRRDDLPSRQLWQIERDAIEAAIIAADGSIQIAAEQLGIDVAALRQKRLHWKSAS